MSKGVLAAIIVGAIVFILVVIVVVVIILRKVRPPQNIQHDGNEPGEGHAMTEKLEAPGYSKKECVKK